MVHAAVRSQCYITRILAAFGGCGGLLRASTLRPAFVPREYRPHLPLSNRRAVPRGE